VNLNNNKISQLPVVSVDNDLIPLVKPGIYTVSYSYHETRMYFGKQPKVAFWFKVLDFGEYFEVEIPRFYNVRRFKGKIGVNGLFVPGRSSDFLREYCQLFPEKVGRLDRIPLAAFKDTPIKVRVRTVERDRRQKNLAQVLKYSVIEEIIGLGEI
jgi:hypothetical protein